MINALTQSSSENTPLLLTIVLSALLSRAAITLELSTTPSTLLRVVVSARKPLIVGMLITDFTAANASLSIRFASDFALRVPAVIYAEIVLEISAFASASAVIAFLTSVLFA